MPLGFLTARSLFSCQLDRACLGRGVRRPDSRAVNQRCGRCKAQGRSQRQARNRQRELRKWQCHHHSRSQHDQGDNADRQTCPQRKEPPGSLVELCRSDRRPAPGNTDVGGVGEQCGGEECGSVDHDIRRQIHKKRESACNIGASRASKPGVAHRLRMWTDCCITYSKLAKTCERTRVSVVS